MGPRKLRSPSHDGESNDDTSRQPADPLPIRSYTMDVPLRSSEFVHMKTAKLEVIDPRHLPSKSNAESIRKFVPNVALDRNKPSIIPQSKYKSETQEFSTKLMLAKLKSNIQDPSKPEPRYMHKPTTSNAIEKTEVKSAKPRSRLSLLAANKTYLGKKSNKKSKHLLELSWPEGTDGDYSFYAPISLPFILREDMHNAESGQSGGIRANPTTTRRPTAQHVDETNRNAAMLFNDILNDSSEDILPANFIHIQLPSILPALNKAATVRKEENSTSKSRGAKSEMQREKGEGHVEGYKQLSLEELPEGKLGKLIIYKNGKVKLRIGVHEFDVNGGSECSFGQEVGCHFEENSEFIFLGKCNHRIVLTPDIETMIKKIEKDNPAQRA